MPFEYPLDSSRHSEKIDLAYSNTLLMNDVNLLESIVEEKVQLVDDVTRGSDDEDDFFDA